MDVSDHKNLDSKESLLINDFPIKYHKIEAFFNKKTKYLAAFFPFYDPDEEQVKYLNNKKQLNSGFEDSEEYKFLNSSEDLFNKKTVYFKENEFIEQIQIYFSKENFKLDFYKEQMEKHKNKNSLKLELKDNIIAINFSTNSKGEKNLLHNEDQTLNREFVKQNCQKLKITKQDNFLNEFSFIFSSSNLNENDKLNNKIQKNNDKVKKKNTKIIGDPYISLKSITFTFLENSKKNVFQKQTSSTNLNNKNAPKEKDQSQPSPNHKPNRDRTSSLFNNSSMLASLKNYQRRKSRDLSKSVKNLFKLFNCLGYVIRLLTLLLLSIIGFCIYYYFSQNILKGLVILHKNHLKFPTKLHTDEHGIIHIRAANFEDAFFTLGYAQARDRLWQIDFLRRFAKGKLSHLLGAKALKIDKYMRNLGISFRAKHDLKTFSNIKVDNFLSGNFHFERESLKEIEMFKQVEKFVDGVNFYAKNNFLPLEYYILNVGFKKFSVLDCFAISRLMSFLLTCDWHVEIFNHVLELSQGKEFMHKFDLWNFRNFPFANESVISYEDIQSMNLNFKSFEVDKIFNFKDYKKQFAFEGGNLEANKILNNTGNLVDSVAEEAIGNETLLKGKLNESEELSEKETREIDESKEQKEEKIDNEEAKRDQEAQLELKIIKKAKEAEMNLLEAQKLKDSNNQESMDINMQITHASNSWVIHGNLTKSGKPLLTNDPHLTNRLPSLHYIAKLYVGKPEEDIENVIVGSSFPGIPAFLFGNNKNISWGVTTDNRDTIDIVEEFVTPDYKYFIDSEGNVAKTFSRKEKIKIKNEPKQFYKIYYTENGVLLDEYLSETSFFGIYYKHALNISKFDLSDVQKLEKLLAKENINININLKSDNDTTSDNDSKTNNETTENESKNTNENLNNKENDFENEHKIRITTNHKNNSETNSFRFNLTEFKLKANKIHEIRINNQTFIRALSLRFPTFDMEIGGSLKFYFDLMKAKQKEDFMDSIAEFSGPVLAFSWATTANEIGYTSIGKIPVKNFKESKIIFKEAMQKTPENFEIQRILSREETPVLVNPKKGFIVTANNEANPWNYKHYVQSYAYFNRFHRINELLESKFKDGEFRFGVEDSIEMLGDLHDSYVEIFLPKLLRILENNFSQLEKEIKELKEFLALSDKQEEKDKGYQKVDSVSANDNENNKEKKETNEEEIEQEITKNKGSLDNQINNKEKNESSNHQNAKEERDLSLLNQQLLKETIEKFSITASLLEEYETKLNLIHEVLTKLKNFDFKFTKESEAASIYSILEYLLGRNLLLKGQRNLEDLIHEYKRVHGFIDENFDPFIPGFDSEREANGLLNNMNYWNFMVNLITEVSEGKGIELENCNFYNYYEEYKTDFLKGFFIYGEEKAKKSSCEKYIATTLIYFLDFVTEKNYMDKKTNKFQDWGSLHYNNYPHEPFENVEFLRLLFSRHSSTGGTRNTVKVSKNKFHDPKSPFVSTHSANFKYICDLADITRPYVLIDTGNSGNILSKFYDNFVEKSENNEFVKVKDHNFNDDYHLLISFPEDNTLILKNPS